MSNDSTQLDIISRSESITNPNYPTTISYLLHPHSPHLPRSPNPRPSRPKRVALLAWNVASSAATNTAFVVVSSLARSPYARLNYPFQEMCYSNVMLHVMISAVILSGTVRSGYELLRVSASNWLAVLNGMGRSPSLHLGKMRRTCVFKCRMCGVRTLALDVVNVMTEVQKTEMYK